MRIIARRTLYDFWKCTPEYADAEGPLDAWYYEAKRAQWSSPDEIREQYGSTSILKNSRVVFNIGGNKYRLVVKIHYASQIVYVRFVGAHRQYDQIDAETI